MSTPAGWYPDAHGVQRWWDGYRWTDAVQQPTPYTWGAPARVAPGTPTNTVWIWLAVAAQAAIFVFAVVAWTQVQTQMQHFLSAVQGGSGADPATVFEREGELFANPWYLGNILFPFVACGASVLFAYFDRKELQRRGFDRPFHWAWAFLGLVAMYSSALVYTIGRAVVIARRGGRGRAPMVVSIVVQLVFVLGSFALTLSWMAQMFNVG